MVMFDVKFGIYLFACGVLWVCLLPVPKNVQAQRGPVVADSIQQNLAADELRNYRRQRLSVVIKTETRRTIDITGERYHGVFGQEVTSRAVRESGTTYKKWIPYKGLERTTEVNFFETSGYPNLAEEARDYHTHQEKRLKGESWLGFIFGSAGVVGVITGIQGSHSTQEESTRALMYGAPLALLGLGAFFYDLATPGEEVYQAGPPMRYPASQVHGISGEYNRQLYQKLSGSQSSSVETDRSKDTLPASTTAVDPEVESALSLPGGAQKVASTSTEKLEEGDIIVSVEGSELESEETLSRILTNFSLGDKIQLELLREGSSKTVSVTLGETRDR